MKVKPNDDWKMDGTGPDYIQLDKTKVYVAIHATNQPDWEEEGKIFVIGLSDGPEDPVSTRLAGIGFLLKKGEYEITEHGWK